MGSQPSRAGLLPAKIVRVFVECGHCAMAAYWAIRLMLNRSDTRPTYMYCWHLDRVTYFRNLFQRWLDADPEQAAFWSQPRMFIDEMPDPEAFRDFPKGTLGRAFYEMCRLHDTAGLLDLRKRRLECLPAEARGLDMRELVEASNPEERYELMVARRNIFMTSTHDLCHMLTGANTDIDGEAIVAKYQFHHLLVPQNWLNMVNAMLVHLVSLRWLKLREIAASFPVIEKSANYARLDYARLWHRPLGEVRRELGLPENGFTNLDEALAHDASGRAG